MYQSAPLREESVARNDGQPQPADRDNDEAKREQRTDLDLPAGGVSYGCEEQGRQGHTSSARSASG